MIMVELQVQMRTPLAAIIFSIIFLSLISSNEAYRVLVSFPMPTPSHAILGRGIVNNLLEAGHEVVFITSFPKENPVYNLKEIDVINVLNELKKELSGDSPFKIKDIVGRGNVGDRFAFMYFAYAFNKKLLEHEIMTKFLSDPDEKFDAVVLEWFFSETVAGIAPLFQCPLIWLGSTEVHGQILRVIDEVPNPAYNTDLMSTNVPPFTFWQRVVELYSAVRRQLIVNFINAPFEKAVYNDVFPKIAAKRGVPMPSYEEAIYNASLMLVNSDPLFGTAFRLPQNVKYIGGYHIDGKVKPLPEDLQKLMDTSKNGVVYFSMGSMLKSVYMTDKMKETFLKVLGNLKQDVIWKFEGELKDVPKNIYLTKWAPQQSILAHPNLKLFITHGGQLSITECVYYGVPIVGLPVLGDQFVNLKAVEQKGFGIVVELGDDIAEEFTTALNKVLKNPEYKTKAKYLSSIFHDRLVPPGKELVHWIEHVVRTKGAPHLRSKAVLLSWYQKFYVDGICLLMLIIWIVYKSLKCVFKRKNVGKVKVN